MNRKFIFILLIIFSFIIINENVYAKEYVLASSNTTNNTCDYVLGDVKDKKSVAYFLQEIFNLFKYGGPILCVVLSMIEFIEATASQDKDFLIKATKRTGTRIVLALLLFFIPTLINFLFTLFGWIGTCGIS